MYILSISIILFGCEKEQPVKSTGHLNVTVNIRPDLQIETFGGCGLDPYVPIEINSVLMHSQAVNVLMDFDGTTNNSTCNFGEYAPGNYFVLARLKYKTVDETDTNPSSLCNRQSFFYYTTERLVEITAGYDLHVTIVD